jgi:hypothetical protein
VWGSLARDYLSIMASSVSSEHVFSSAGITLSKRRNRLQADIVEALQFLKWAFKSNLTSIFRDSEASTAEEEETIALDCDGSTVNEPECSSDICESDTEV